MPDYTLTEEDLRALREHRKQEFCVGVTLNPKHLQFLFDDELTISVKLGQQYTWLAVTPDEARTIANAIFEYLKQPKRVESPMDTKDVDMPTLVKFAIEDCGGDGLWNPEGPCGCGIGDFAPCCDGPFRDCVLARRLRIPDEGPLIDPKTGEVVEVGEGLPGHFISVPF